MTDAPEGLNDLQTVDRVVPYQTNAADFSAILTDDAVSTQEIRVFYLKHMRDEYEWAFDNVNELAGFVAFKRRGKV